MHTYVNATPVSRPPPPPSEEESRLPERDKVMARLGQLLGSVLSMDTFLRGLPAHQYHEYLCFEIFTTINLVHSALGAASPIDEREWQPPFTMPSTPMTGAPQPAHVEIFRHWCRCMEEVAPACVWGNIVGMISAWLHACSVLLWCSHRLLLWQAIWKRKYTSKRMR